MLKRSVGQSSTSPSSRLSLITRSAASARRSGAISSVLRPPARSPRPRRSASSGDAIWTRSVPAAIARTAASWAGTRLTAPEPRSSEIATPLKPISSRRRPVATAFGQRSGNRGVEVRIERRARAPSPALVRDRAERRRGRGCSETSTGEETVAGPVGGVLRGAAEPGKVSGAQAMPASSQPWIASSVSAATCAGSSENARPASGLSRVATSATGKRLRWKPASASAFEAACDHGERGFGRLRSGRCRAGARPAAGRKRAVDAALLRGRDEGRDSRRPGWRSAFAAPTPFSWRTSTAPRPSGTALGSPSKPSIRTCSACSATDMSRTSGSSEMGSRSASRFSFSGSEELAVVADHEVPDANADPDEHERERQRASRLALRLGTGIA